MMRQRSPQSESAVWLSSWHQGKQICSRAAFSTCTMIFKSSLSRPKPFSSRISILYVSVDNPPMVIRIVTFLQTLDNSRGWNETINEFDTFCSHIHFPDLRNICQS